MNEEITNTAVEQIRRSVLRAREITEGVVSTESSIAQSLSVPNDIEVELTPETMELVQQLQAAMEEVAANEEIELEPVPVAVPEQPLPVPPEPEPPVGYENDSICCGYVLAGSPSELETYIKRVIAGTWYVHQKLNRGSHRRGVSDAPNSGAWRIVLQESNAGTSHNFKEFWVNNYWAGRFDEADAEGRALALANHIEIPLNSGSLAVDETTTRFSGAIWYEQLQTKSIILAGVGGIGSYIGFLLARMKPARLVIFDNDVVEAVNMSGQLYGRSDIGHSKVDALANMVANYADYHSTIAMNGLYNENSAVEDIMICGFDNMAARKLVFMKWYKHVMSKPEEERGKCLLIDGRLAAEELQVLAVQGNDTRAIEQYQRDWLFNDGQADATVCSYKQTTFMANMIASLMVNIFVNFVANECNPIMPRDVPFYTSFAADTMYFKVEM